MNQVKELVLENMDEIEKAFKLLAQGCKFIAVNVGELDSILKVVRSVSAEILETEGSESKFIAEQFKKVIQKLKGIQYEIDQIHLALQQSTMNKQYFDYVANIISQYEKFQIFVNATTYKEKAKEKFIIQYENTGRDGNIDALYNAVTGENFTGDAILDTVVTTEQRSRKQVEEFCTWLKMIFVMGIIAMWGYATLKKTAVEKILNEWRGRFKKVEKRMKAAVDDCINNFHMQAKMDVEQRFLKGSASVDPEFARSILDMLKKKYYWVSWSVQVVNHSGGFFLWNWLAGKKYNGSGGGGNFFDLLTPNSIKIVVSFSADPKPINKSELIDQIEAQKLKGNMESVAQMLGKTFPNTVVHAISTFKKVEEKNNFQPECFYFEKRKNAYLCVHSE
ncbi:hypothetical protein ABG768_009207 [Culter alburnus]|uniref:Uncharacterized protein n=1 Tax=Culter alburnus TaxID=194366 RepID=A0AAW1ZMS9_CULAL